MPEIGCASSKLESRRVKCRIASISLRFRKSTGSPSRVNSLAGALTSIYGRHIERRKLHSTLTGRGLLEDQPFVLIGVLAHLQRSYPDGQLQLRWTWGFNLNSSLNRAFEYSLYC